MPTLIIHRPRAKFSAKKNKVLAVIAAAQALYTALLAQVLRFPSPTPTLVVFLAQLNALVAAQQLVGTGTKGLAAARNAVLDPLWISIKSLVAYVLSVADLNPADALTIIKSAMLDVAVDPTRNKPLLDANLTTTPGEVEPIANASLLVGSSRKRGTYNWQSSVDGGHTWVAALGTPVAETTLTGLPLLTTCQFRVCVTRGKKTSAWSQAVTLFVH